MGSTLSLYRDNSQHLEVVNSVMDSTCTGDHVIEVSGSRELSVDVTNSTMNLKNCTCQNGHGLTVSGPISTVGALTTKGSSVSFGACFDGTSKQSGAQPDVMLV